MHANNQQTQPDDETSRRYSIATMTTTMRRNELKGRVVLLLLLLIVVCSSRSDNAFFVPATRPIHPRQSAAGTHQPYYRQTTFPRRTTTTTTELAVTIDELPTTVQSISDATNVLQVWDQYQTVFKVDIGAEEMDKPRSLLPDAVRILNQAAVEERKKRDSLKGQCLLGICASSGAEGFDTLKSWVTSLNLPRGLLHGMDVDGKPVDMNGGVYIKYNSGGVLTFADIRKSGRGFDALWKPGDAMLEEYDGDYRGVYFQVDLSDGEFRQFLLPLDLFSSVAEEDSQGDP